MSEQIYLDNAATTRVDDLVVAAMLPYFTEHYGNPSSTHTFGQKAHVALNTARRTVADILQCNQENILFTSGASESINMIIHGFAELMESKGKHIITSSFEHSTTLAALKHLETKGWEVTYITPNKAGFISAEDVAKAMRPDTVFGTYLSVQNELGTMQPIVEIAKVHKERGVLIHIDAAQAIGATSCNIDALNVDALTLAGHKFHGPKGISALYLKDGIEIPSLIHGTQEFGLRAGTQNVPLAVGLAKALEIAIKDQEVHHKHLTDLRKYMEERMSIIPDTIIHNPLNEQVSSHILSIAFPGTSGESLLRRLDLDNIAVSTGAACASGNGRVSHVLTAIGLSEEIAQATLRISLSRYTTKQEIDTFVEALAYHVGQIRHMNITY